MFWKTAVLALFVVGVFADGELEFGEDRINQLKQVLMVQCGKVNATDKVDDVTASVQGFFDCVKNLVNVEQLKREIEEAKPNGALDEVFKKYCAKTPQLKTCIHSLIDGVKPCLDTGSQDLLSSSKNGTDQLIDFVCYKDGDRIALFIAEHGPECFTQKANAMRDCVNKVKQSVTTVDAAKSLTLAERCAKFDEMTSCTVTALEGCDTPTPGNMAESLFRFVRKSSPCNDALPKN